jgi:hypothetical protein
VCNLPFSIFKSGYPTDQVVLSSKTEEDVAHDAAFPRFGRLTFESRLFSASPSCLPLTSCRERHTPNSPRRVDSTGPLENQRSWPANFTAVEAFLRPTSVFTVALELCGQPREQILQQSWSASTIANLNIPIFNRRRAKPFGQQFGSGGADEPRSHQKTKEPHILSLPDQVSKRRTLRNLSEESRGSQATPMRLNDYCLNDNVVLTMSSSAT